jgi:small subunit ribosomal protein S3e
MDFEKRKSTKKKFVADGVFKAEVHELLMNALADFGFSGMECNFTKSAIEVRVVVSKFNELMDTTKSSSIKIKELELLIKQRYGFNRTNNMNFTLFVKRANHNGINAHEQAEYLKKRFMLGVPVRTGALSVIRQMLRKGAKGCEVIISGKLRQQRAKSMKFRDGYMVHTGEPKIYFMHTAVRHLEMRQGIIGIKVRIMLPYEPRSGDGKHFGCPRNLPDIVEFFDEKNETPQY